MRAMSRTLKQVAAVAAVIVLNAFLLSQLTGGITAQQPSSAFAQPYGDGLPCTDPGECESGFCEQGCCCATECTPLIPAPSLSWTGQLLSATLLTLFGWFGLRRMRRQS
jgi:hypothetical protein